MDQFEFIMETDEKEKEEVKAGIRMIRVLVKANDFEKAYEIVKGYFDLNNNPQFQIVNVDKLYRAQGYPRSAQRI